MLNDTCRRSLLRQDEKRRLHYSIAERSIVTALSLTVLLSSFGRAQPLIIQPSSYGIGFDGEALRFECVASLKTTGPKGLAFPNLDLEVRFGIGTSDEEVRRASVLAVKEALGELRSADAMAGR